MSIEQAAQRVLKKYLQDEANKAFGAGNEHSCVVNDKWAAPDQALAARSITILPTGPRQDTNLQAEEVGREDQPGALPIYTWRVSQIVQPIQLDVWANYAAKRDELIAWLDVTLRQGERYTLGTYNGDSVRDGVLLRMAPQETGFDGFVDCTFEGPKLLDTTRSVSEREYRASILGELAMALTIKTRAPQLKRVLLKTYLDPAPGPLPPASDLTFALNTQTGDVAVTGS